MKNTDFNQFEKTLHETLSLGSHIQFGQQIIIAVSGGKDSMTLLYSMCRRADRLNVKINVVHVNHQRTPMLAGAQQEEEIIKKPTWNFLPQRINWINYWRIWTL